MGITNRIKICCFSGYRPEKLPWGLCEDSPRCKTLKNNIALAVSALIERGVTHFICGMARGADMYFAEEVLRLRETFPITFEAALPCEEQAAKWPEESRSRYFSLIGQCDYETLVSRRYTPDCMTLRNRYMVDNSGTLIAVFDGRFGGTMQTIGYARRSGLEIIEIRP